jgi:hypothetical protein
MPPEVVLPREAPMEILCRCSPCPTNHDIILVAMKKHPSQSWPAEANLLPWQTFICARTKEERGDT